MRGNQINKNGKSTIMIRVTLNSKVTAFSSKLEIEPELWAPKLGKAKGRSNSAMNFNSLLDNIRASLTTTYHELCKTEQLVTTEKIKNSFLGLNSEQQTILKLFAKQNEETRKLVGKSIAKATQCRYELVYSRLKDYILAQYKVSDISLKEINYDFIKGFETYLTLNYQCKSNAIAKLIQIFKGIVILARNNGWIIGNPFANYKIKFEKVDRGYLSEDEIQKIMEKKMENPQLEQVRDIFVFSCYTGLAYIDVKNLTYSNIRTSFDGNLWIMTKRQKTSVAENVPLLPVPLAIIEKYRGMTKNEAVLPVLSNQKMNDCLKEIGDLCGIDRNLTYHVARHSFATILLSNGVSIESVSKMLGHANIKTTQIYARITDNKISNEMQAVASKLKNMDISYRKTTV